VNCADQQKCCPHSLRKISKIEENLTLEFDWKPSSRRVVCLLRDSKKLLGEKGKPETNDHDIGFARREGRLLEIPNVPLLHLDEQRLAMRIKKYGNHL